MAVCPPCLAASITVSPSRGVILRFCFQILGMTFFLTTCFQSQGCEVCTLDFVSHFSFGQRFSWIYVLSPYMHHPLQRLVHVLTKQPSLLALFSIYTIGPASGIQGFRLFSQTRTFLIFVMSSSFSLASKQRFCSIATLICVSASSTGTFNWPRVLQNTIVAYYKLKLQIHNFTI